MKKFTFMLIAAFVAVASWAGVPVKKATALQLQNVVQLDAQKKAPKLVKAAAPFKVTTPVTNRLAAKVKANVRRAPKKAGIADLLKGDLMLVSDYSEIENQNIIEGTPAAGGWAVSASLTGENTLAIEGFTSSATEPIEATFELATDPELLAKDVLATATIAAGQTLFESSYGPVLLDNALEDAPLTAYVFNDGTIVIDGLWYDVIGGDGQYAGYMYSGYLYSSAVVAANGTMEFTNYKDEKYNETVYIFQDAESPKSAVVYNFAGEEAAVEVSMKTDGSFIINEQPIFYYNEQHGYFNTTGLLIENGQLYINSLTGVCDANVLTFDGMWAIYSPTSLSIYSYFNPAIITRTDGVDFLIPTAVAGPATPADPEILRVGNYDSEQGYGSVAFTIPVEDVDGNDLNEEDLYYQLFSRIDGKEEPIVFTPEICERLTEDMTEIPYTFTDNWDFEDKGTYKVVFLNYNFNLNYEAIGVQSIYKGGGETNKSEIVWADVEKAEPVGYAGDFTFDFNKMDVPTSSSVNKDGDITEAKTITEGSVSLTISTSTTSTPNRFWGTTAGPQLRVYGGTLTFEVPEGAVITQIVFNHNGKWGENTADSGKITNDTEANAATWTGEAQTVVVTIAANSQINSIDVTVEDGEGQPQPEDDVLVALPDGVEPIEYTLVLNGYTSQSTITAKDTKYVAFDGNDVYLQGLAYYFDEAYVKGTLDGNGQIIVESGQFVGEDEYGKEYLVGAGVDEEGNFFFEPQIVFNYDKESGKISLVEGTYYGESGTSDAVDLWDYFEVAEYTPGAYVAPEVVVLPEGVEPETWTLEGVYGGSDTQYATGVAFDGNDIYVQGLAYYFPEAWVKGTISDGIATFPTGQFVGSDEYGDEYLVGVDVIEGEDEDEQVLSDIKYVYDAEAKTLTQLTAFVAENDGPADNMEQVAPWGYWLYSRFFDGEPVVLDPVVAPEGLETEAYSFQATVSKETEDEDGETVLESVSYVKEVNVGFDGNDLYIQGISEDYPEGWVKATKNEAGQYVIPANQFMGTLVIESIFGTLEYPFHFGALDDDLEIADAVLDYDAETNTISTEQMLVLNGSRFIVNPYQTFTDVTITKVIEMAGTPADPSFIDTKLEGTNYPYVVFDIPTLDTDGNPMLNSKLFFTVWVEKNGPATPYTVQADEYENVENDMVEIPYTFDDDYDIYGGTNGKTFYFNPADEVAEFTNIGVQSIYYGGGETNKSDIIWMNGATTGVKDINTANNTAVYYDLQGRKVTASQKGLLIKQSRQDNGTITTVKVVRK